MDQSSSYSNSNLKFKRIIIIGIFFNFQVLSNENWVVSMELSFETV